MKFTALIPVALATLFTFSGVLAQDPETVVSDVQSVTQICTSLQVTVSSTTIVNVYEEGALIVKTLGDIITNVTAAIPHVDMPNAKPFSDKSSVQVDNALSSFVSVNQKLLSTIAQKYDVLSTFEYTDPMRVALQSVQDRYDVWISAISALTPTRQSEVVSFKQTLDVSLQSAIATYSPPQAVALRKRLTVRFIKSRLSRSS